MIECGKNGMLLAGLQNGIICLCSNVTSQIYTTRTDECSTQCSGASNNVTQLPCGGENQISVYDIQKRIIELQLQDIPTLKVYEECNVSALISFGDDAVFKFDATGDAATIIRRDVNSSSATYIYDRPGKSKVIVRASNQLTSMKTAEVEVTVTDTIYHGNITCPQSKHLGDIVECMGFINRGAPGTLVFDFGDNTTEIIHPSVLYGNTGIRAVQGDELTNKMKRKSIISLLLQAEFVYDSVINAWEFEAIGKGLVYLQVFRPQCDDSGKKYCRSKRSCLPRRVKCNMGSDWICNSGEYYCFMLERCLPIFSNSCLQNSSRNNLGDPPTGYQLIAQCEYNIEHPGHKVYVMTEGINVKEGDIIGWTGLDGEINFSQTTSSQVKVLEFVNVNKMTISSVLEQRSNPSLNYEDDYVLSALYTRPAQFHIRHNYTTTGAYHITSNATEPALVFIDVQIDNISVDCPHYKFTNESFNITITALSGTNISYILNVSNGVEFFQSSGVFNYSFSTPGVKEMKLGAINPVSSLTNICHVRIYDDLTNFKLYDIAPVKFKSLTEVYWSVEKGTNVTYFVDFGDETFQTISNEKYQTSFTVEHLYSAPGYYNVTIMATNDIGSSLLDSSIAVVDAPIRNLYAFTRHACITKNIYLQLNETIKVYVNISEGTNVFCEYNFNNNRENFTTQKFELAYSYQQAGAYNITIRCYNSISEQSYLIDNTIVVEKMEEITNLVINGKKTIFGKQSQITASMSTGSLYYCLWELGDGNEKLVDKSIFRDIIYHQYTEVKDYTVRLRCSNLIGNVTATYNLPVEIPLNGLGLFCPPQYIIANEEYTFTVHINGGSRLSLKIDFGDKNVTNVQTKLNVNQTRAIFKHNFSAPGEYNVTISAWNQINESTTYCPYILTVEYTVYGFNISTNSPLRFLPGIVKFHYQIHPGSHFPTNAQLMWAYGDDSDNEREMFISMENSTLLKVYKYKHPGVYTVRVKIKNNISEKDFVMLVDVQKMKAIQLQVMQNISGEIRVGKGRACFLVGHVLFINVTSQRKDKLYTFDFGDLSPNVSSILPDVHHVYQLPGTYIVRVRVENILGIFSRSKEVDIQEAIEGMNVTITPFIKLGDKIDINITAVKYGSKMCGIVEFNDGAMTVINRNHCEVLVNFNGSTNISYTRSSLSKSIRFTYEYTKKGYYNISVLILNSVSIFSEMFPIFVKYVPCPKPEVLILGAAKWSSAQNVLRCSTLLVHCNVTLNCPIANNITFTWQAFKNGSNTSIDNIYGISHWKIYFSNSTETVNQTTFKIDRNLLPYGLVNVRLLISYGGAVEELREIFGQDETWFNVLPCNLSAVISGPAYHEVKFGLRLELNASILNDTDKFSNERLYFKWFCRKVGEQFGEISDSIYPLNGSEGCFRSGHFLIPNDIKGVTYRSNDLSKLVIDTNYVKPGFYVIRVYIRKGHRIGMFDKEVVILHAVPPPSLVIKCVLNCYEMVNPTEALVIRGRCTNCDDAEILYTWQLFALSTINGDVLLERKIEHLEGKITTPIYSSNIALKANVLNAGKNYTLRLSAVRNATAEAQVGSCDYKVTVNLPPYGGNCSIYPTSGVSLNTLFQIECSGWRDERTPLHYVLATLRDGIEQNVYRSLEPKVNMVLPVGNERDNHSYGIVIKIEDIYQFSTKVYLNVTVTEPVSINYYQIADDINSLAEKGETQAIVQMSLAAGSIMNKKSIRNNGNISESKNTRTKMIMSLSKVKACSLSSINQLSGVQQEITKISNEVSQEAQNAATGSLGLMSSCMKEADPADFHISDTAKTMISMSSNLLEAGMSNRKNLTAVSGKTSIDKVMDNVDKVAGAVSRQLVVGDKSKRFKTQNMEIEISQVSDDTDQDEKGFKLPKMDVMFGNKSIENTQGSVGAMVTSMKENPYKKVRNGDDIDTDVMALSLGAPDGDVMDLSGLEVSMFLKRDLQNDEPPAIYEYNSDDGTHMNVHRFNYTKEENSIAVEIEPLDPAVGIQVYISYRRRPVLHTLTNYTLLSAKNIVHFKTTQNTIRLLSPADLNGTGQYYIGIQLSNRKHMYETDGYNSSMNYTLRIWETVCKVWDEEAKQFSTKWCKVGPKTTFNKTECICLVGGKEDKSLVDTISNYSYASTGNAALSVNRVPEQQKQRNKVKRVTFAGGFFVMPNPIDFSKAFAGFKNISDNPVAFATVLSIFGVYLILLFWARREDRKDVGRCGATILKENNKYDCQFYKITVNTGFSASAGTTANVFIQLSGDEDQTEVRQLKDENRKLFKKRASDVFLASFPAFIGDIQGIRIWHDNTGSSPSWNLNSVVVHDLNADRKYLLINEEKIIAVESGDGSLERAIPVAGAEQIKSFNHLFFSASTINLSDGHLWFSVFIRPPKSRFTRVQRLSCCLTLLYCTMVTNAMFYEIADVADPATTLHVGPFAFSISQIGIAVMTSLIIFPVNILIVGVFRSIGIKPSKEEMAKKKAWKFWWLYEIFFCCPRNSKKNKFMDLIKEPPDDLNISSSDMYRTLSPTGNALDGNDIKFNLQTETQEKENEEKEKRKKKLQKKLPYWMKYFAWILLISVSFTSAFFVILYGFQFGKEKSAQWLSALLISFIQDVCVSQPLKILGLSLFIAMIVKKPVEEEELDDHELKINEVYMYQDDNEKKVPVQKEEKHIIRFKPPSKEKIKAMREYRLKEIKMVHLIQEIFIYIVFVIVLCQVTYSFMDPNSYNVRRSMENVFIHARYGGEVTFNQINSIDQVWLWLNTTVVTGLYSTEWYNGQSENPGFLKDLYSNLFGGSRLRQLRVRNDTCHIEDTFRKMISVCHGSYSWSNEDIGLYDRGWLPISNDSRLSSPPDYRSWQYHTSGQLETYPFVGSDNVYRGGGYVADLGKDPLTSYRVIKNLHDNRWLDAQTRAVFLEATIYNAQVNLFAIMNFVVEFYPTNGVVLHQSIKIASLYSSGSTVGSYTVACRFFVLIFFFFFLYREGKKIYRQKKTYFRGFWNMVEVTKIVLIVSTIGVFFSRMLLVKEAVKKIHDNAGKFVSFNKVVQWDVLFSALTSVLVFICCVKAIKLLQYNKTISLLASTLKGIAKPIGAFFVVFTIFFMAFTIFAYLVFVPQLEDYRKFIVACESVLSLLLGNFAFDEFRVTQPILGPIWFVLVMIFGVFYIMNVFLSIIMETYARVKEDILAQNQEYELVDFMVTKFKNFICRRSGGSEKTAAEAEESYNEKRKQTKKKRVKFCLNANNFRRNIYNHMVDREIETKFSQLNESLNEYFIENFDLDSGFEDGCSKSSNRGIIYAGFNYSQVIEDLDMKRELDEELLKWS